MSTSTADKKGARGFFGDYQLGIFMIWDDWLRPTQLIWIDFVLRNNFYRFSSIFIDFHRFSSIFINFHQSSSIFIDFHRFSSIFIDFYRFSSNFINFLRFFTDFHQFPSIFYRFSSIFIDFHRFSPFYIDFHRFSYIFIFGEKLSKFYRSFVDIFEKSSAGENFVMYFQNVKHFIFAFQCQSDAKFERWVMAHQLPQIWSQTR